MKYLGSLLIFFLLPSLSLAQDEHTQKILQALLAQADQLRMIHSSDGQASREQLSLFLADLMRPEVPVGDGGSIRLKAVSGRCDLMTNDMDSFYSTYSCELYFRRGVETGSSSKCEALLFEVGYRLKFHAGRMNDPSAPLEVLGKSVRYSVIY